MQGTTPETDSGRQPGGRWTDRQEGPCPVRAAGRPYPARRQVRQQNWMKSLRSQSRLDLTISQKVSSAGPPGRREEGHVRFGGQLGLFPSPHSAGDIGGAGAAALPVTPVMCGGPGVAEARAESGRQKRTRGGRGVGRAWGHLGCAREPSGSLCLFLDSCAGGLGRKMGSGLAGAGWRLRHDPGDTPNRGGRGSPRGKG